MRGPKLSGDRNLFAFVTLPAGKGAGRAHKQRVGLGEKIFHGKKKRKMYHVVLGHISHRILQRHTFIRRSNNKGSTVV